MKLTAILDLLFPRFCLNCEKEGAYLCSGCFNRLIILSKQGCPACRRINELGKFCHEKCAQNFAFDQLIVCSTYEKAGLLKKLLVLLKYRFAEEVVEILGKLLKYQFAYFSHNFINQEVLIVPVPLHKKRLKYRSFNQAWLLAEYLARSFNFINLCDCLERKKFQKSQALADREERIVNLKGSFEVKEEFRNFVKGRVILLVDDVATTCSTLNECSGALKVAGAKYICGLVLARGRLYNPKHENWN